jgi:hypothetical protein
MQGYKQVLMADKESLHMVPNGFLLHYKRLSCIVMDILKFKDLVMIKGEMVNFKDKLEIPTGEFP